MRAIEIQRNGSVICTAGFPGAILLSLQLDGNCETAGAGLSVHGMAKLGDGHNLHLWWFNHLRIADGDEVTFALVEAANLTTPSEEQATNSPEYIAEQQEYEERASLPMVLRELGRSNAGLIFDVRINNALFKASLDRSRELLSASLTWSDYGDERCRFRIGSISIAEAMGRTGGKEWLTESIKLGDKICVKPYRSP
jgi:hypothetical protein